MPVFSSVSSGRHSSQLPTRSSIHPTPQPPLCCVSERACVPYILTHTRKVICFSSGVESRCQVKASIGRDEGRERIRRPPLYPANLEVNREGWSFKQSAPSFIIHATALKISFRNTISSLLSLSLLPFFLFFFPDRTSIKYE